MNSGLTSIIVAARSTKVRFSTYRPNQITAFPHWKRIWVGQYRNMGYGDPPQCIPPVCVPDPIPPCPPRPPPPCRQICEHSDICGVPVCREKPKMKGLHWAQTKRVLFTALTLSFIGGCCVYVFIGRVRMKTYKDYYDNANLDEWVDEMARRGLFQAVPIEPRY